METVTVEFAPNALNAIKAEVIRGFKSIPRRGAEVGGLLCGSIVASGKVSLLRVESIVPVPVEHRFGPTYRFSEADKQKFRKALEDWAPLEIIGWYRSQARPGEAPAEEDRAVSAEFFPDRISAFLICYPDATLNVPGKMCIWLGGQIEESAHIELGRYSLLEEALQSAEAAGSTELEAAPRTQEPKEMRAAAAMPPTPPAMPLPAAMPMQPQRNGKIALITTLTIAISFGAYLVHARLKPNAERPLAFRPAGLGMKVDRQGPELLVSWNRQAPEIMQAADANFKIVEDGHSRTLALSPHELRTGSLLYTANADDIQMELDVNGPAGEFAESVRVVGTGMGSTFVATPIAPKLAAAASPVRPAPAPVQTAPPPVYEAAPQQKNTRAFVPPPRPKTENKAAVGALPEAPALVGSISSVLALPVTLPGIPAQKAAQRNAPATNAPVVNAEDYVPPHATRSVQPSLGSSSTVMERAFDQSNKPYVVQIEVSIDERGTVTNASIGAISGPFAYLFVDPALTAARRWQFEPAKRNGRPVPSKMTLKFEFVRNNNTTK